MKKIILFVLLLTATSVLAQSTYVENGYHTMLSEGKVWNYTYHTLDGDQEMSIEVKGDTVIEGTKCRKLYLCLPDKRSLYGCYYEQDNSISDVYAYMMLDIQKENGRLVMQPQETASPLRLLYSFMSKSVSITYGWLPSAHFDMMSAAVIRRSARYDINTADIPYPIIPSRCELIRIDDDYFARTLMTDLQKRDTVETWVSGVGERYWGIMQPIAGVGKDDGGEWVEFESCEENGRCLFTKAEFNLEALHQDYRPFVEDNKTWTCYGNPEGAGLYCYRLRGDTLVNDQNCLKLYSQNKYNNGRTLYEGALYEQDKRVYIYKPGASECSLLYDFSLKPGEEVTLYQNSRYSDGIRAITDVYELHAGQLMRIMAFYEIFRYGDEQVANYGQFLGNWIEGVGPGYMLDVLHDSFFNVMGGSYGRCIIDCSVNGQSIYRANDYDHWMSLSDYYYYRGNKIPLFLNKNKVVVSIPKEYGDIIERFHANVQTWNRISCESFDSNIILRSEYEKLTSLDFWAEDSKSVVLTSSYYTENGDEVFATPYLTVRLKKKEDIDLLTSYAERYKLSIVKNMPTMPLWYILHVIPETEKSPMKCANELYESGDFAESIADFAFEVFPQKEYRPFIEDGKVWKVGDNLSNPVQRVEYYYFDGDTIINGKACKQMMRQRYVSPDHPDYTVLSQSPSVSYVGAWYEEGQKVYYYNARNKQFRLWYDFSANANDTLLIDSQPYVIGPKQTGGLKGFKGVYRDVTQIIGGEGQGIYNTTWLEGVGGIDGPMANVYYGKEGHPLFLMECFVGDEVIYLNDEYEDGATPESMNARKRFDFTHTTKLQPKAPIQQEKSDACIRFSEREVARPRVKAPKRRDAEQSLYGEYNDKLLGINLDPIDDAYLVRITDEAGKAVYEKAINAGNIVGLSIDISSYPKGCYTVTVENSNEAFTGQFDAQTTGIEEVRCKKEDVRSHIYNLQGQRLSNLQKGLNIVNGHKVYVK